MTVQYIEIGGQRMAVLPEVEFRRLQEEAEELDDIRAAQAAERRAEEGEEYVPLELVDRLIAGDHPLRVWREYRGLSQQALGERVNLSKMTISGIETGRQDTNSKNWRALAAMLGVDVDDIMPDG